MVSPFLRRQVVALVLASVSTGTIIDVVLGACPSLCPPPADLAEEVSPVSHG